MMYQMKHAAQVCVISASLGVAGCAATKPQVSADLNASLQVAAAAESAYAAQASADPKVVAQLTRLLESAQAALTVWQASNSSTDEAVAGAAIAALVEYEATATPKQ